MRQARRVLQPMLAMQPILRPAPQRLLSEPPCSYSSRGRPGFKTQREASSRALKRPELGVLPHPLPATATAPPLDTAVQQAALQRLVAPADETTAAPLHLQPADQAAPSTRGAPDSTTLAQHAEVPADVCVVDNVAAAEAAVRLLLAHRTPGCQVYHAVDTEVADIDVVRQTPLGHGRITCLSVYAGPEIDFGGGTRRLWVDVLVGGPAVLQVFKAFLEDETVLKVWHNYAFDRHIFENEGIKPRGFGGDTMHMARLWNSSRTGKGYSLEALTKDEEVMRDALDVEGADESLLRAKRSMKELFAQPNKRKDGTDGKLVTLPSVEELQMGADTRAAWIDYSALDAQATWLLRESLECKLRNMPVDACRFLRGNGFKPCASMWDFYLQNWRPFGELLVDMEREGMLVDNTQLKTAEKIAKEAAKAAENHFRSWAIQRCEDARWMNVGSGTQVRQLLYGGLAKKGGEEVVPPTRVFKVPNDEWEAWDRDGRTGPAPKKQRTIELRGITTPPLTPTVFTASGLPSTSSVVLRSLVGKTGTAAALLQQWDAAAGSEDVEAALKVVATDAKKRLGEVYTAFGSARPGIEAAAALDALCEASAVETLLTNFILPLQSDNLRGPEGRVHCSLNINTETGRLSARRPNLQNQPALEKDRYGIRKAFVCEPGNSLVVADYGQLELRLLAHMANCKSMLEAFRLGGDFHSRTALGMYPHVRKAVEVGDCLLEWDGPEKAPVPLLKDMFANERRKAKILNFSIAYGKTKHGLSRDWNVSLEEAEATVAAWYSDRPEVKAWQEEQHQLVQATGKVCTLLGRQRHLPDAQAAKKAAKAHALRAAINTPIQGGAADIAMLAMLELRRSTRLKELGWRLLMQVHDEVILEGSQETSEEALAEVKHVMEHPFGGENLLLCALDVSANFAGCWYEAK